MFKTLFNMGWNIIDVYAVYALRRRVQVALPLRRPA